MTGQSIPEDSEPHRDEVGSMASLSDLGGPGEKHYEPDQGQIVRAVHQRKIRGPLPADEVTTEDNAVRPQPKIPVQDARATPPGPSAWEARPAIEGEKRPQEALRGRLSQS